MSSVVFVLCQPQDARNVGACLRAAANHGLLELRMVRDLPFDPRDLECFSAGASRLIHHGYWKALEGALWDCDLVLGTSRRHRDPSAPPWWPASGLKARLPVEGKTAILFGNERIGLTLPEVDRCQALLHIPTDERFPSMNLGHAVACVGYELARPDAEAVGPSRYAVVPKVGTAAHQAFYDKVRAVAAGVGYPPGRTADAFTRKLKRVLDRAQLSAPELNLLSGIFSELRRLGKAAGQWRGEP